MCRAGHTKRCADKMNNSHIKYLTLLIGVFCGFFTSCSNKPSSDLSEADVKITILSDFSDELKWREIKAILIPYAEMGLCNIEINNFLFELPSKIPHPLGKDDDPLLLQSDTFTKDHTKLQLWSQKHIDDEVEVSFGETVDFDVIKDVITILRENKIEITLKEKGDVDSSEIMLSLYGSHPRLKLHNQGMDPTR